MTLPVAHHRRWHDGFHFKRPIDLGPKPSTKPQPIESIELPLAELKERTLQTLRADLRYLATKALNDRHHQAVMGLNQAINAVDCALMAKRGSR
jgi:hypothetical protein